VMIYSGSYHSPIGYLSVNASEMGVVSVVFSDEPPPPAQENDLVLTCIRQLDEYFNGKRDSFTVPLHMTGTAFQRSVWNQLRTIPFGETTTYSELAALLGNPNAARAIGAANGKNQIAILIPCHRVIGKNKDLTGFAWGTWRKEWLLHHEQRRYPS
jgi:methylated-DNA-[protein]-cysteine S-methyltransferase